MTGTKDQREGRSGLRSREWFDNPDHPDMTALYLERYLNYGLSIEELQSDSRKRAAILRRATAITLFWHSG